MDTKFEANIVHDGNPPFDIVIPIDHKMMSDGSIAFTSSKIQGLLVLTKDINVAIKQLPVVITELLQRNHGVSCHVSLGAEDNTDLTPKFAILEKRSEAA